MRLWQTIVLIIPAAVNAQNTTLDSDLPVSILAPVTATSTHIDRPVFEIPASVSLVSGVTMRKHYMQVNLSESLNGIPGLRSMLPNIPNPFRQKNNSKEQLIGLWLSTTNSLIAEMAGIAGYDWLVLDGEHALVDIPLQLQQLQALNGSTSAPVGRPPVNDPAIIK